MIFKLGAVRGPPLPVLEWNTVVWRKGINTRTVTIQVESHIAEAYASIPMEDKQRMQRMLSLYLQYLTTQPDQSLLETMVLAREQAAANGLTPEILESLLDESK